MTIVHGRQRMPPVADMARELDVHWRTIYRLLDAIEAAHWPMPPRRMVERREEAW